LDSQQRTGNIDEQTGWAGWAADLRSSRCATTVHSSRIYQEGRDTTPWHSSGATLLTAISGQRRLISRCTHLHSAQHEAERNANTSMFTLSKHYQVVPHAPQNSFSATDCQHDALKEFVERFKVQILAQ